MGPATELERRLIERFERSGAVTFRDFMDAALYDPELGYYNTERLKIGPAGDYYTSSNVHPAFGAVLASSFVELGLERSSTLVELGAGTGQLAYDVLSTIRQEYPAVFERLSYIIVESSARMRERQRDRLAGFGDLVRWFDLADLEQAPINGIAFSNEFVDALPVHRVRRVGGGIEELYVTTTLDDESPRLRLSWGRPSTDRLSDYVTRMGVPLCEGQIVEINLDAVDWIERMSPAVRSGFLITIDYGDLARDLWCSQRSRGTLRSFHRHRLVDSPLERIGEQDITASVNFTVLIEYGRDFGFEFVSFERQTAFLIRSGLIERIAASHSSADSFDDLKSRLAIKNLFVPAGISDSFRVLIQKR
ncbi:MAG TPA: SAM-dependent methyltransferase [Blastocatellia bacterium]|nr:SAM-dependent methyltransferase [Blastocatellia bacterium]